MKRKGFTLIELLVAIIIIGILATMATAFFSSDYKKQKQCIENLEKISKAIEKYRDATGEYPPDGTNGNTNLKDALYPVYISDANVFKCPADTDPSSVDSYSEFYVKRHDSSNMAAFTLGCYRHDGEKSAINLFFQGQTIKHKLSAVDNGATKPGDTVTGLVSFSDGSTADITGSAILVQSFDIGNGKCYSLLKVKNNNTTVDCAVTPGSKFEVITPSAIAGVGGTRFTVTVEPAGAGRVKTTISVTDGIVTASDRNGRRKVDVKKGDPPLEFEGVDIYSSDDNSGQGSSGGGSDDTQRSAVAGARRHE